MLVTMGQTKETNTVNGFADMSRSLTFKLPDDF
jgi:hypothetical protein